MIPISRLLTYIKYKGNTSITSVNESQITNVEDVNDYQIDKSLSTGKPNKSQKLYHFHIISNYTANKAKS